MKQDHKYGTSKLVLDDIAICTILHMHVAVKVLYISYKPIVIS